MKILDISPLISEELAVFPGDVPFERQLAMSFAKGHHLELSSIRATLHLGAHADSSSHYHPSGQGIEARDLSAYYGPAQVVRVKFRPKHRISLDDFDIQKIQSPRVLFATGSFSDPNSWTNDFMAFAPEVIEALARNGARLIGIDTPSVDLADSKDLPAHQMLFKYNLAVLEGLVLEQVPEGVYTLCAFPLKIKGADAAPVRAVLLADT